MERRNFFFLSSNWDESLCCSLLSFRMLLERESSSVWISPIYFFCLSIFPLMMARSLSCRRTFLVVVARMFSLFRMSFCKAFLCVRSEETDVVSFFAVFRVLLPDFVTLLLEVLLFLFVCLVETAFLVTFFLGDCP